MRQKDVLPGSVPNTRVAWLQTAQLRVFTLLVTDTKYPAVHKMLYYFHMPPLSQSSSNVLSKLFVAQVLATFRACSSKKQFLISLIVRV